MKRRFIGSCERFSSLSTIWGTWAKKMRIASAFTKPTITVRGTNRINSPTPRTPKMNWKIPARIVAAKRKPTPWSATRSTTTRAMAPVAAEIMPERPPAKAITIAIENDAYRPTWGATPAMIEKLIASGINASATTRPDRMSAFGFVVHEAMKSLIPPAGAGVGALVPVDDIGAFRGQVGPAAQRYKPDLQRTRVRTLT